MMNKMKSICCLLAIGFVCCVGSMAVCAEERGDVDGATSIWNCEINGCIKKIRNILSS